MYAHSASVYDAVYAFKDYAGEAARLESLIRARVAGARTLLDVARGTGKHLAELRRSFDVAGLELEPEFARIARDRLPGVQIREGDMTDFDLGRSSDAPGPAGTVVLEMQHVVGRPDGVESFGERHELGMFTRVQYVVALRAAGLAAEHEPEGPIGRGLSLGRRGA